jgi:pimeloyl-ACP methyl ester carboxylesterase
MHDPTPARARSAPTQSPLFVHESGVGTPLLLIHGLLASGSMFDPVLPAWSAHHRVIVPDLRGHGRSGALPGPYGVGRLAHDLAQLLDDLQVETAHVLGYSQGGAVAQQLAHDHPERVRGLVLGCTFAHNALSRRERLEALLAPWLVRILGVRRLARLAISSGGGRPMPPETAHWLQGILEANETWRMVAAVAAMEAFDSRPWLKQIACPTLVIAGAEDRAVPLLHAEMLVQGIPHAQLRMIDGAGHFLLWTDGEVVVRATEAFLATVDGKEMAS